MRFLEAATALGKRFAKRDSDPAPHMTPRRHRTHASNSFYIIANDCRSLSRCGRLFLNLSDACG